MKNETIGKINSIGKVSRIVAKIAQVVALIGTIACLVVGVVGLFIPKNAMQFNGTASGKLSLNTKFVEDADIDEGNDKLSFLGADFEINAEESKDGDIQHVEMEASASNVNGNILKLFVSSVGFVAAVFCGLLWIVMRFAVRFSKTLEICNSPFEENVLADMKKLGISLLPFGIFTFVTTGVSGLVLVLIIMLVILFINIFKYGAELQQESDDTV
ncbi:MAG: hypothetical protein K2I06_03700 [Ruminococcus sp.]|nr:hypothetical protein [Ruminococcus sp.]